MGNVANDPASVSALVPPARPAAADLPQSRSPLSAVPEAGLAGRPLREVLRAEALAGAVVVAGTAGLDVVVERLNVMEVPDILPWVKPGELLLTTGYPLRERPGLLAELVPHLAAAGVAAVGLKLGRYLDQVPADALAAADRVGLPLVLLPDDVAFDDVIQQVLGDLLDDRAARFARAEELHASLVQVMLDGHGLPEVARVLADRLGCAVLVTTTDGRILTEAGEAGAVAAVYASGRVARSGRYLTEHEDAGVHGHDGMPGNHAVIAVLAGGVDHGRLVVHCGLGELREDHLPLLDRAATVVALAITRQLAVRAVESKYQGDFLRDVVSGRVGAEQAVTHAGTLGWDLDRPVVVVVAELDADPAPQPGGGVAPRPALERFAAAWQTVVRPRDPHAAVAGFTSEVVAVLGIPADGDVDRLVRDVVREVSGDGGGGRRSFSTGVSRVVPSAERLPRAYEQAVKAARVGRRVQGRGAVAHFDALGVFRLLSLVEDQGELDAFVTETLGDLALCDDADMADLRRTLEVLLETNLNVAETARTLHFHYNTLRYRIAKLERMVGPFTRDAHLRLNLAVALQVLALRH